MKATPLLEVATLAPDRVRPWTGQRGYVATGDADDEGRLSPSMVSYDEKPSRADLTARSGDVLMARMAGTEKVFEVDGLSSELVYSTGFAVLRPDPTRLDAGYLRHWLRTRAFQSAKDRYSAGATQRAITNAGMRNLTIPMCDVSKQRRIAAILDNADALRAKRRQVLGHLDDLGPAIFRQMFGHPVTNEGNWPLKRLADLGTLDRGVSKHRPRNDPALLGGTHPLIQTGDVANSGGYIKSYHSTYSDLGLAQSRMWPTGTLCITIAANIAKTGILTFDACFPDSVVGFTSNREMTSFVQAWLGFLQATLEASAPQSAQKNINLAILRELKVPVPGDDLVMEFHQRVCAVTDQRASTYRGEAALGAMFTSLQSGAFRGEL